MNNLRLLFLFVVIILSGLVSFGQVPDNLSSVKASQISDQQLQQYILRAKENGYTPEELEKELLARGLPESEMQELRLRIEQMGWIPEKSGSSDSASVKSDKKPRKFTARKSHLEELFPTPKKPQLFGAELFSNTSLVFEPDMRMATPKDYVIGPEDELVIQVFGQNVSQQTATVSPDGTINIKYAGVVLVAGLSVEAATSRIKTSLSKYYPSLSSGQTKLNVTLGNIRSIRVVLIGAVNRPGTYTLPSLATLYNALYVSGGPTENGSLRTIELIRNGKTVAVADLYDFLTKGDLRGNARLEDNDVIRIPYAKTLITIGGLVNRPGIFEIRDSESLATVIDYAGGFSSKAFRNRITGRRYDGVSRQVLDISNDSFPYFRMKHGDEFHIDSVINRYENRVIISGAVMKPGEYALFENMSFYDLIQKAHGLKEDVYSGRALLVRTRADLSKEHIPIDLQKIINGTSKGPTLKREDSVSVSSIFDLKDTSFVTINGAVRFPGKFRFEDSLSLKSLIIMAGGYAVNGTGKGIEISRRRKDINVLLAGSPIVEIIHFDDNMDLSAASKDLTLQPYDIVAIKENPNYLQQISVKVSGEVLMPAVYALKSREERISSLIQRSGGLLYTANIGGAKLIRQRKELLDTSEVKRLLKTMARDTTQKKDEEVLEKTRDVAIDLAFILDHPGSSDDITLEEGDELYIPRINNTVSINGEVYKPLDIMYERHKSMKDYLSDAGGVTQLGKKRKAFIIYPNGRSARIKKVFGFIPSYPEVQPGSSIFVPEKPKRSELEPAKAGILISALTAFITGLSLILR
ncbi:SLBB domain-containing protein [Flavihumibacter sp. UBA7668]|uniref:SLBB domain-containing protein n=1 Tax=Flavihumibacter sp. UBA7668 TaxID=1946542 RepID=UPI0025C66B34|nr:SLBB domain-containing protein [Flavihumibacter sp. UBA7668]